MAWLCETFKLYQKMRKCIDIKNPNSGNIWRECYIANRKIKRKLKTSAFAVLQPNEVNKLLLQQKELWITNKKSVEEILKHLIFHGNHYLMSRVVIAISSPHISTPHMSTPHISTLQNRGNWLIMMLTTHNYCCKAFEKFDLVINAQLRSMSVVEVTLAIEFIDKCNAEEWERIFWQAFAFLNKPDVNVDPDELFAQIIYGFVLVFGAKRIENMLLNKNEKELQKQIINSMFNLYHIDTKFDAIKWSKIFISWRNHVDIEKYGQMFIPRQFEQNPANHIMIGDVAFLYAKMHLKNNRYLDAKYEFIYAIYEADSFVIISLSLQYLSNICQYFDEYGIGFKCLKLAYKLCHIDNEMDITPSFVEKYGKKKRLFIKKLNNMKCGYCGMKNGIKLGSCSGCMKMMYCNKKCQKKHWKNIHHNNCDNKFWSRNYQRLKNTAIFNVKI